MCYSLVHQRFIADGRNRTGMLTFHRTSILKSQTQTVVNTVNTVGVMGKGIAAEYKSRYPEMFKNYKKLCKDEKFKIGMLLLWKIPKQWVLNFPTKIHWRNPSKLSYIEAGLKKFVEGYESRGIREIAFPRLGCGNGGLDWQDVRPLMEGYLNSLPIQVFIHDFEKDIGLPEHHENSKESKFYRSYETFLDHINGVLESKHGRFCTVSNNSPFSATFDKDGNLLISRSGRRSLVSNDELYELWTLLLRGPLTRRKLPGGARDSAYYLFPILSQLPYIRPIEIGDQNDTASIAVELVDLATEIEVLEAKTNKNGQGKFEWA